MKGFFCLMFERSERASSFWFLKSASSSLRGACSLCLPTECPWCVRAAKTTAGSANHSRERSIDGVSFEHRKTSSILKLLLFAASNSV